MADTIGEYSVKLSANASGLVGGLDAAEKRTGVFSTNMVSMMRGVASQAGQMFQAITRTNLGQQLQPLLNIAVGLGSLAANLASGNIVGAAASFAAVGISLATFASSGMDAVSMQERLGRQLGITAQEAAGLQTLSARALIPPEQLNHALQLWPLQLAHLRAELDHASGGPMVATLARMGINAREFANASLPEQFARLAAGSRSFDNEMERSAALMGIMGRHARDLMPLFRGDAEQLRNLGGVAAEAGYSITQSDAQMISGIVRDSRRLSEQIGAMVSNLAQGAAVTLAPMVGRVVGALRVMLTEGRPLVQALGAGIGLAINAVLGMWDKFAWAIQVATPIVRSLSDYAERAGSAIREVGATVSPLVEELGTVFRALLPDIGDPIEWLARKITEFTDNSVSTIRDGAVLIVRALAFVAEQAQQAALGVSRASILMGATGALLNQRLDTEGFAAQMEQLRQSAQSTVDALNALNLSARDIPEAFAAAGPGGAIDSDWSQLAEQIERANNLLGATREEIEMIQAREAAGAMGLSAAAQERLYLAQAERQNLEYFIELQRAAERNQQRLQTPGERIREHAEQALNIFDMNRDQELFDRTMIESIQQLLGSAQKTLAAPSVAMQGSIDAQRAIAQQQRDDRQARVDPQERVRLVLEQQRVLQQQQRDLFREMLDEIRTRGPEVFNP